MTSYLRYLEEQRTSVKKTPQILFPIVLKPLKIKMKTISSSLNMEFSPVIILTFLLRNFFQEILMTRLYSIAKHSKNLFSHCRNTAYCSCLSFWRGNMTSRQLASTQWSTSIFVSVICQPLQNSFSSLLKQLSPVGGTIGWQVQKSLHSTLTSKQRRCQQPLRRMRAEEQLS